MPPSDTEIELKDVERGALEHLDAESGRVESDLDVAASLATVEAPAAAIPRGIVLAVGLSTLSAAIIAGGIFIGVSPRIYGGIAGLLGVALGVAITRVKQPTVAYILMVLGLFAIGLVMVAPSGLDHLVNLRTEMSDAISSGKILKPPVDFTPGWIALLSWIMATVGFGAAWTALAADRPSFGVMVPLPLAAFAGISVTGHDVQIGSALAAVVLFGAALGMLANAQLGGRGEGLPLGYELRRGARGFAFLAVVTAVLYGAAQTNFLFPHPIYDPTLLPQKPKPISLSAVQDKVLFEVSQSQVTGPWVIGDLDVYDGTNWLLPPFAENQLQPVPKDGIVDSSLHAGQKATFTIRNLTGAVLPALPSSVGILSQGLQLEYDHRSGNIRLFQGKFYNGFQYTVVAAAAPNVADLITLGRDINSSLPPGTARFEAIGPPPAAVQDLIKKAPTTSKWEEFDYLRNWVLQNVVAAGVGTPTSITSDRVQQILTEKEASPFEIVAVQAMLGRWAGIPARIGYGFDGGTRVGDHLEIHPVNGTAFPEVYFPRFSWVPVIGVPAHAKASENNTTKQTNPDVLPSNDISVLIYIPEVTPTSPPLWQQLQPLALLILVLALVAGALYVTIPPVLKLVRRARRRAEAARRGPRAEVAEAYAEWREHAADYGYLYPSDTPLMFVDRFVPDEEHKQLAWLVTRVLWGDLGDNVGPDLVVAAKELSRTLRVRLSQARPITVRAVAMISTVSLRHPYEARADAPAASRRSAA